MLHSVFQLVSLTVGGLVFYLAAVHFLYKLLPVRFTKQSHHNVCLVVVLEVWIGSGILLVSTS